MRDEDNDKGAKQSPMHGEEILRGGNLERFYFLRDYLKQKDNQ